MRKRIICTLAIAGLLILNAGLALGSGFSIYEAGSKATALGCAFTATADDGSALFYNSAGLSFMTGSRAEANVVLVAPQFSFSGKLSTNPSEPTSTGEAEDKIYPVPGVYYTNNPGGMASFGIGVYAPYGLGVVWENGEEWIGRRISHDVQIQTVYVTPAVSLKLSEGFALSAGIDIAHQELELKKFSPEPQYGENAIHTTIKGSSEFNLTPTLGLMYRPNEKISLGPSYHFKKTMKFEDGEATLEPVAPGADPWGNTLVGALGTDQTLTSELNLPDILSLGIAYRFSPKFKSEFNYVRFGWSTFESLALNFGNDALDQTIHFNYEDSWQLRFGFDYVLNEKLNLMAGYVYDKSPQPLVAVSPLLPDSNRNDYSFGALYKAGNWDFNISYMLVVGKERTNIENGEPVRNTTDYPYGTYKSLANLLGFGVGYNF